MSDEIKKLEDAINKQKNKALIENVKLAKLEYQAKNLGMYDNVIELFNKKAEAGLQKTFANMEFEIALSNEKYKKETEKK